MYPAEWHSHSPVSRKRRHVEPTEDGDGGAAEGSSSVPATPLSRTSSPSGQRAELLTPALRTPLSSQALEIPRLILRNINTATRAPTTPAELDLDVILSRVPYKEILENLFGRGQYGADASVDVPIVARSYEESYMRQPMSTERACVAGDM